jgi:peptide/nickel transport system substrate-binding protein
MKKWLIASAMTAALVGTNAIAAPSGTFKQAHEYGYGDKSSLDPASRGRVMQITEKLMSRLIRPDMKGSPSPDLATSWNANDAATEWTMKLRTGVKFHDGSAFDASDVV